MKRISKFLFSLVLLLSGLAIFGFATPAAAAEIQTTVEYAADSTWSSNVSIDFRLNTTDKTAAVLAVSVERYSSNIVIPQTVDYEGVSYTVISIEGTSLYGDFGSIDIPGSVTYIAPYSVGYYTSGFSNYLKPSYYFEINAPSGSEAERYATENDFIFHAIQYLNAADVTLEKTSYTYTGSRICPKFIVKIGDTVVSEDAYYVSYTDNINVGTGKATLSFYSDSNIGGASTIQREFTIKAAKVSKLTFPEIEAQAYSGYEVKPCLELKYKDNYLYEGTDYTVSYSSNINPGTAKMTIKFKGNYSGTKKLSFKIKVADIKNLTAQAAGTDYIMFSWDWCKCSEYRIYLYNETSKKYELCKKSTWSGAYIENEDGFSQLKKYKFAVRAVLKTDDGNVYGKYSYITVRTGLKSVNLKLTPKSSYIKLSWTKNSKADGYEIYRIDTETWENKKVKTIKDPTVMTWKDKSSNNADETYYRVVAYKKDGDSKIYSSTYDMVYSFSGESRLNAATLKSHKTVKIYNTQGKKTKSAGTMTLSSADIKILKSFASKNFTKGMTDAEKVRVTLDWINQNVTYATSSSDWKKISGLSTVNAIFNKKMGQCYQYNGALAAMMAYLGYDVQLIQGYRGSASGSKWQHYWVEVKIDGNTYVMETGNYGRSGGWSYYCQTYSECFGYIKNGKDMS